MDQSARYADLSLKEEDLIKGGKHILVAYKMKPKAGYGYLEAAAHLAAESSTGTNVEVSTTDDFTKGVDALVYHIDEATEDLRIAYPMDLFDRNMTDGRMMIVSFLTLVIGNNQGMGDIEHAKMIDFYVPERVIQLFDGPSKDISDMWRHPGSSDQGRRLHRRHHHQAEAGPASGAVRQGGLPVLAWRRLHQERRTPGQPGVLPGQEGLPAGL
jgi:ribulose 1,5-bisphosphate carboxylase large subunit-like protein